MQFVNDMLYLNIQVTIWCVFDLMYLPSKKNTELMHGVWICDKKKKVQLQMYNHVLRKITPTEIIT